jgi:5S rRNA maturation endonuclease (ribonuclease M5)
MADFTTLAEAAGVVVRPGSKPEEVRLCCLFCVDRGESPDSRFRLHVNVAHGYGICFNCDWRSRHAVTDILQRLEQPIDDVVAQVVEEVVEKVSLPKDFQYACNLRKQDMPEYQGTKYLLDRGISRAVMAAKQIGVSLVGKYAYRVVFPVYWNSELKGIVARDFTGSSPIRYLNSKGSKGLYNLPRRVSGKVIMCEGIFKCFAAERVLKVPACALLGHTLSDMMVEQLKAAKCRHVVVWPDPDRAGIRGAISVCDKLVDLGFKTELIVNSKGRVPSKQLDEMPDEKIALWYKRRRRFDMHVKVMLQLGV